MIRIRVRTLDHPRTGDRRTQYETHPGIWAERDARDGSIAVYREDGSWIGWTDATGAPKSMAGLDGSLESVVVAAAMVLLAPIRAASR